MNKSTKPYKNKDIKIQYRWIFKISIITIILAYIFSMFADTLVSKFNIFLALVSIFIIVFIGVIFDIIGIAVTAASDVPFLSMASKKIKGANEALWLIKNADHVSSFCNDVVGDVCGIISGSAGGILVVRLLSLDLGVIQSFLSILMSSSIAALTVASKAIGKTFAMNNSQKIVYYVGYLLSLFFKINSKDKSTRKRKERVRML